MADDQRLRRLHDTVPLSSRRAGRFLRAARSGVAAAWHFPPRVRRHDTARAPRAAAAGEPVLRDKGRRGISMSAISGYHAHVYYDAGTREQAAKLCSAAGETFG